MDFLTKLIDYEFNPDCENFVALMKSSKADFLSLMKISEHLKSPKNYVVMNCFKLLKTLFYEDNLNFKKLNRYIPEKKLVERFLKFAESDLVVFN